MTSTSAPQPTAHRGLFVTFEGGEGSGKSTVLLAVRDALQADGYTVTVTREPGGSPIGRVLRSVLLDGTHIGPRTEALLFAAERAHHIDTVIRPALEAGHIVLCDRYIDSSVAYQGLGRGLGADRIRNLSEWATEHTNPDLTLLLDVRPEIGLNRRTTTGDVNRLDTETLAFHQQVRSAFLDIADHEPGRVTIINAEQAPATVAADAIAAVTARLPQH